MFKGHIPTIEMERKETSFQRKSSLGSSFRSMVKKVSAKDLPIADVSAAPFHVVSAALIQKKFDGDNCVFCGSPLEKDVFIFDEIKSCYCSKCRTSHAV